MKTKILLVDDHQILRDGICSMFSGHKDIEVIGEAPDGRTAIKLVEQLKPDIVVMDISMPDMNGIDATRKIKRRSPDIKVIALSMHHDRQFLIEIFRAGASGYLVKDSAFEELERAIKLVMEGKRYINPHMASLLIDTIISESHSPSHKGLSLLTDREKQVLHLIVEGKSTKEIARQLKVSNKTIESHRRQIMGKLNLQSVAELIKFAIREGIAEI